MKTILRHKFIALLVLLYWLPVPFAESFPLPGEVKADTKSKPGIQAWRIDKLDAEKIKKISRVFNVNASDKLMIENKYGKVHIDTWNKNEITVSIEIIARATSDQRAQEILDMITINEEKSTGQLLFKTQISKNSGSNNWSNKSGYTINYTISMPKQNPLQVKNMYGDLYLGDYQGKADLSLSYGSLKMGKLSGENTIKLAYCSAGSNSISQVKKGSLDLSYSKLTLDETENLDLRNSYSDIKIEKAGVIQLSSRYGSVKINSINKLEGNSEYTGFSIGTLSDGIDMKLKYCSGFNIEMIDPKFDFINLDGNYSSFELNFEKNSNFNFNVDLQYGDLKVDKELVEFKVVEKRNTSSTYQGQFGKSSSGGKVNIVSRYGSIKFEQQQ